MPINPNDTTQEIINNPTHNETQEAAIASTAQDILSMSALKTSKLPDQKDIFKREDKEKAFYDRYGKRVRCIVTYDLNDDGRTLKEYTIIFESQKQRHYSLTEYLQNDVTDYVLLCYRKNGRNFESKFTRFIDAEVTLADLIAQEV